jgi:hypothetical protein
LANAPNFHVKKLDELAHLLANPVLPKASRHWSEVGVFIASAPQSDHLRRSFYARNREVLTEHVLEVTYFFEVLRDRFCEKASMDHCSKIEFFGRLAAAADACLVEQPAATAHLVCAAILREAYAVSKQMDERDQIADNLTFPGQRTGYSSIKETIQFFRERSIQIHGTGDSAPGPYVLK